MYTQYGAAHVRHASASGAAVVVRAPALHESFVVDFRSPRDRSGDIPVSPRPTAERCEVEASSVERLFAGSSTPDLEGVAGFVHVCVIDLWRRHRKKHADQSKTGRFGAPGATKTVSLLTA